MTNDRINQKIRRLLKRVLIEVRCFFNSKRNLTMKDYLKGVLLLMFLFFTSVFMMWFKLEMFEVTNNSNHRIMDENEVRNHDTDKPHEHQYLKPDHFAASFLKGINTFCETKLKTYGHFAKLEDVIINPGFGEIIENADNKEKGYTIKPGFLQMACEGNIEYEFKDKHLQSLKKVIIHSQIKKDEFEINTNWTIAVSRSQQKDLYFNIIDIYNTYLLAKAFDVNPALVTVLFIDGHASNDLDSTWQTLFGRVMRIEDMDEPVFFENLIWGWENSKSPLNYENEYQDIPNLEEFREFVLTRHEISPHHKIDCDSVKVVILHDDGVIFRNNVKREVISTSAVISPVTEYFREHRIVRGLIGTFKENLEEISSTDILTGNHKEQMIYMLFQPKFAAVIEFFEFDVPPSQNKHYSSIAHWRSMSYQLFGGTEVKDEVKGVESSHYLGAQMAHIAGESMRNMCVPNYKCKEIIWSEE